ncbi:CGLD27 family protein [Sphaerospermopsis aphanizomenoides BCCUSP55]|uniref:CGLD27 family protein n=1 Tax=Sphaerospermopsis aphanizomenoides TaxID=459663 RepID=UPI000A413F3B|nr:CGLD27 family protein [Sphaerospermopsis aphanizomenoides]MBK1987491.1 CGLD27 family protein [Sphaerospermopsis aphanizomenoides BCCUSP55]
MMKSSVFDCPVPTEQQPLNEYEELKNSWLFRDTTLRWPDYLTKIFWIWGWSWFVAGPVAAASFPPQKQFVHFMLCGSAAASMGVVLLLVRLYLGWFYVRDRLYSSTVFYEESGWYDGQTWTKPQEVITRDRLIVTYEIKPILQRLQITFAALALMYLIGTIVWHLL